jgi:hypothetical protein
MWRAPLVDEAGRLIEEGKTLHSVWHLLRRQSPTEAR